jgi:hypothetical protein
MAAGVPLHQALSSAGYLAAQSSAVHLTGAVSDGEVARILAADYCGTLTDRRLSEIGAQRHGRDVWIAGWTARRIAKTSWIRASRRSA